MNQKGIWLSLVFIAGIIAVPLGYSNAEMENQTNTTETSANMTTSVNATENIGQQVSAFVHEANDQFKQQRNETISAIKDCREKIRNATPDMRSQVASECHQNLVTIKDKYKDVRQQFQELFKRFRDSIIVLRHEANTTSSQDKDDAIKKINDDVARNGLSGLENALKRLKGMGLEHGKMGIEHAMQEVNKTRGNESMSLSGEYQKGKGESKENMTVSSNASVSQNAPGSVPPFSHAGGENTPGEGKGKK